MKDYVKNQPCCRKNDSPSLQKKQGFRLCYLTVQLDSKMRQGSDFLFLLTCSSWRFWTEPETVSRMYAECNVRGYCPTNQRFFFSQVFTKNRVCPWVVHQGLFCSKDLRFWPRRHCALWVAACKAHPGTSAKITVYVRVPLLIHRV